MRLRLPVSVLSITFSILVSSASAQTIDVTTGQTSTQLVNSLIGSGISWSNATGSFFPDGNGKFVNNAVPGFTLDSGIVLTNGNLVSGSGNTLNNPASYHNSTDVGYAGDTDLDALVAPMLTQDATVLEFDFVGANDSIEFNFVFASEEYNDYANTAFNDVFAFFVSGPGYPQPTNVALLPGTTTAISINNVNNGNSFGTASGPCMNCSYYVDNVGTNAVGLSYDGFTTVIKIKFPVWPCSSYHFKIALADVADGVFDSMVMLEENSFAVCPLMQPFQNGVAVNNTITICVGGSAVLSAPDAAGNYLWTTGDTTQSIVVTQPGIYGFSIIDPNNSCFAYSTSVTVIQQGIIQTPVIVQNGNSLQAPNLVPSPNMTYQWFIDGAPIPGATQATLNITGPGCYTLTIYEGTCESLSNELCITSVSISEVGMDQFSLHPHPITGTSLLETPFPAISVTKLELFDLAGRLMRSETQTGATLELRKGTLPSGCYMLRITNTESERTLNTRILIQ